MLNDVVLNKDVTPENEGAELARQPSLLPVLNVEMIASCIATISAKADDTGIAARCDLTRDFCING